MKPHNPNRYTPARYALLVELWPTDIPSTEILDRWNALPGERTEYRQMMKYAGRLGIYRNSEKPGPAPVSKFAVRDLTDRLSTEVLRMRSDAFGALAVIMTDHPGLSVSDPPPVRYRSIMERPDPTRDAQIAARAEQARRTRLGRVYDSGGFGL